MIQDGNTWNIIRIVDADEQKKLSFKEAQHRIRLQLRSRKQGQNKKKILRNLIERAYYWPADLFEGVR